MKKSIGDSVAAEMQTIINSVEHQNLFYKSAKKQEAKKDEKEVVKKETAKKDLSKKEVAKKDEKEVAKKETSKKDVADKKDLKKDVKKTDKKDEKKKAKSFNDFVNLFTKISSDLDALGFDKSAAMTLQSLDLLISEVAVAKYAQYDMDFAKDEVEHSDPELEGLDDLLRDPHIAKLLESGKSHHAGPSDVDAELAMLGITPDSDDEGMTPEELAQFEIDEEEMGDRAVKDHYEELAHRDLGEANDSILKDLGLAGCDYCDGEGCEFCVEPKHHKHHSDADDEMISAMASLDSWIAKYAHLEDGELDMLIDPSDVETSEHGLSHSDEEDYAMRVGPGHWKKTKELSPEDRLKHEFEAALHSRDYTKDPDALSEEDLESSLLDEVDETDPFEDEFGPESY